MIIRLMILVKCNFFILIFIGGCSFKKGGPCNSQTALNTVMVYGKDSFVVKNPDFKNNDTISFIDKKYLNQQPFAGLKNLPVYADSSMSFTLSKGANVQIYAVGEMINALAKVKQQYYLGNDNIELYFDLKNDKGAFNENQDDRQYVFTWVEDYTGGLNSKKGNIIIKKDFDSAHYKVSFFITFPWKDLGYVNPNHNVQIGFDMAVSDNDDGIRQKGKIAWNNTIDSMTVDTKTYGTLSLDTSKNNLVQPGIIYSKFKSSDNFTWTGIRPTELKNIIAGLVKDKSDCSALIRSCWDKKNLYFFIEVTDYVTFYNQRYITAEKRKTLKTFFDYGWIEDSKGKTVWQMNALYSTHAGGAIKNQKIDTIIHLPAGRYTLHYTSDESHAWNNWDDDPPSTPFYGIVLYNAAIKK